MHNTYSVEHKLCDVVQQHLQASVQVSVLWSCAYALVEDVDEVIQAVLIHGIQQWHVSHDEVENGATLRDYMVLLSSRVDFCFSVLCISNPPQNHLCRCIAGKLVMGRIILQTKPCQSLVHVMQQVKTWHLSCGKCMHLFAGGSDFIVQLYTGSAACYEVSVNETNRGHTAKPQGVTVLPPDSTKCTLQIGTKCENTLTHIQTSLP